MARYVYPLERDPEFKSRIVFQVVKVNPPTFADKNGADPTLTSMSGKKGSIQGTEVTSMSLEYTGDKMDLYLPMAFQVNDALNYSNPELGLSGAAAQAALNNSNSIPGAVMSAVEAGAQSITDFVGAITAGNITDVAVARGLATAPSSGVTNAVSNSTRIQVNPNIRTLFSGVGTRTFSFTFKFIPTSGAESLQVKEIIRAFRLNAYPEKLSDSKIDIGYKFPNMFKIRLLSEAPGGDFQDVGTPIKLSYLTAISTNYNPTSAVLHADGSPTEIDLTLSFMEYKPLTRQDVENEGQQSFYHYENKPIGEPGETRTIYPEPTIRQRPDGSVVGGL